MGTTVSTIHVYSCEAIPELFGAFRSFSEAWQTRIPEPDAECDFDADRRLSRRISGQLPYPVLWFWELDGDEFGLTLFVNGKQVTMFRTEYGYEPKGLYKLPPLIGYPEGNKKRFARILSCTDLTDTIAMLEEYLGVCLEVFEDLLETPSELRRERDDRLYRAWLVEEKRLAGKHAPIQLELVEEIFGLVELDPAFDLFLPEKRHIFYLAQFHTLTERRRPLPAVEFRDGRLIPADDDVVSSAELGMFNAPQDPRFQLQFYPKRTISFTELCPEPYRGRVFDAVPRGYDPCDFDLRGHLILHNHRGGIAFMNADGKLIAKCGVSGFVMDYRDGCFLTDGRPMYPPHGWGFDPDSYLRIYRIVYKDE